MFNARMPAILNPLFGRRTKTKRQKQPVTFTQAELQQLQSILKTHIGVMSEVRQELSREAATYWNISNKDDPTTQAFFDDFSAANRNLREVKQHLAKIERLQTKVKRAARA